MALTKQNVEDVSDAMWLSQKSYAGSHRKNMRHLGGKNVFFAISRNLQVKGTHEIEGSVTWGSSGFDFYYKLDKASTRISTSKINPHNASIQLNAAQQAEVVETILSEANQNLRSVPSGKPNYLKPCVKAMPLHKKFKIQTTALAMLNNQSCFTNDFIVFILKNHNQGLCCSN